MSLRVTYEPERRPRLRAGENEFEVADISEMGLSFYNDGHIEAGQQVVGTVMLLCGESIGVEGMVVRKNPVHIYMNARIPIAKDILAREIEAASDFALHKEGTGEESAQE